MSDYSDVLEPNITELYRGIKYNNGNKFINDFELNENRIEYNAKSEIQSWTTNERRAKKYFSVDKNSIGLILKYNFSSNNQLLFNTNFTNTLANKLIGLEENEIIRLTDKSISCEYEIFIGYDKVKRFNGTIIKPGSKGMENISINELENYIKNI